jgi:hypothetical protein
MILYEGYRFRKKAVLFKKVLSREEGPALIIGCWVFLRASR